MDRTFRRDCVAVLVSRGHSVNVHNVLGVLQEVQSRVSLSRAARVRIKVASNAVWTFCTSFKLFLGLSEELAKHFFGNVGCSCCTGQRPFASFPKVGKTSAWAPLHVTSQRLSTSVLVTV